MSTNNSNNSAEIIVKGSTFQERGVEEDSYPDPNTLPSPSHGQRITDVTLPELIPGKYVSTTARVVYLRAIEKQDALGSKMIFSGILEDSMFKGTPLRNIGVVPIPTILSLNLLFIVILLLKIMLL